MLAQFTSLSASWVSFLLIAAFIAGAVDAIVGGGGLIQLPAALMAFNKTPILALGTHKLASVVGTTCAAVNYVKKVKLDKRTVASMFIAAVIGANIGANFASVISGRLLNLIVLLALIFILLFLFKKKELGLQDQIPNISNTKKHYRNLIGGFICGIWDGIAGPGTGTLLIFYLIFFLKYSFLTASSIAKIVNTGTNISALLVFIFKGDILWKLAILMAISNLFGSILGVRFATKYGSEFVRKFFFIISVILIFVLGYKVIFNYVKL